MPVADRSQSNDAGAMLLLTALILAIGFIALAGMASRLDQVSDQAELTRESAVFEEVDVVVNGVHLAMDTLASEMDNATFESRLEGALAHLARIELGRGHYVAFGTMVCDAVSMPGSSIVSIPVFVASTTDEVTLTIRNTYAGNLCP